MIINWFNHSNCFRSFRNNWRLEI